MAEKTLTPKRPPEVAIVLAKQGVSVFPVHWPVDGECSCGNAECGSKGKHPLTDHGVSEATRDEAVIEGWFSKWPLANLGIATGSRSGVIVLDVDGPDGEKALAALEREHGKLPTTREAQTGRGRHLYFALPEGVEIRNSAGVLGPHLDIRGEGGYVLCPPSMHISGKQYRWTHLLKSAALPKWIPEALRRTPPTTTSVVPEAPIPKGQRNDALARLAGTMRRPGMTPTTIAAALLSENRTRCQPPLPESEVRAIARSVSRYQPEKGDGAGTVSPPLSGFTPVQLGELLAKPDTPVEYILENRLVAGTVSAVVAKPKVGKSTFARNLCLAVSRGEDFLGLQTKRGECIYLALEEREDDVKNDFRAMGADGSEPIYVHAAAPPADGVAELCKLIRERRPVLVVGDPLFRLACVKDENAYAELYNKLGPLIDVARETGTHMMLCHHSGKSVKAEAIDSPLGTTALGGIPATLVVIKRTEAYRTVQTVQRVGPELPETILAYDVERHVVALGAEREEADRLAVESDISSFLQGTAEVKTEPEITEAVEGKTRIVRRALRELVKQGKVDREGEGKKGDPYTYKKCLFSCSKGIVGTREQESENGGQTRINTGEMLVPDETQNKMLVPGDKTPQKQAAENTPLEEEFAFLDEVMPPPKAQEKLPTKTARVIEAKSITPEGEL